MATLISLRHLTASRPRVPGLLGVARTRRRQAASPLPRLPDSKRRVTRRPLHGDQSRGTWLVLALGAAAISAAVLLGGFPTAPSALPASSARSAPATQGLPDTASASSTAQSSAQAPAPSSAQAQALPSRHDQTPARLADTALDLAMLPQQLTGRWLYELNHQRGRVRELITFAADGRFTSQILVERAGQPVAYRAEAGRWSMDGTRLRRSYQQANGVELERHLQNDLTVDIERVDEQSLITRVVSRDEARQGKLSYHRVDDQMELPDPDA